MITQTISHYRVLEKLGGGGDGCGSQGGRYAPAPLSSFEVLPEEVARPAIFKVLELTARVFRETVAGNPSQSQQTLPRYAASHSCTAPGALELYG